MFYVGLFIGAVVGFFIAALCYVTGDADERMPKPTIAEADCYWVVVDDLKYGRYYTCSNCYVHSNKPTEFCPDCKQKMANHNAI